MRYQDRVAVVTGASRGIGKATAAAFAKEGAKVVLVDVDKEEGDATARELQAVCPHVVFLRTDVADVGRVKEMADRVLNEFGRLDVLVNNAGVYAQGDVLSTGIDIWNRILGINLTGAFLCSQAVIPAMIRGGGGVIINVASEAGLVGIYGQVAYNVSKGGLIALTRSCAVDLAEKGIRVNCVCPGTTDTPLVREAVSAASDPVAARRRLEDSRPLKRLGTPEEIAAAILYLASDEAGYATGAILSVDGGYTAQ